MNPNKVDYKARRIARKATNRRDHLLLNAKFWPRRKHGSRLGLRKRIEIQGRAVATIRARLTDGERRMMGVALLEALAVGLTHGYDPTYQM